VADEHPAIVESVSHLLEHVGGFTVVGRAADGSEALALIRELEPDLALVDSSLPQLDAVSLIRRVAGEHRPTRIVVYSGGDDAAQAREAIGAGAAGYVLKASSLEGLERAVQLAARGGTFVDPGLGRGRPERAELTSREREVLALLAEGRVNGEIARDLEISALTVRTHTKNAMEKLQAATRSQAVATALRRALI
jgi:DNA-binding NarL/FixJ family response regulator